MTNNLNPTTDNDATPEVDDQGMTKEAWDYFYSMTF